MKIRNPFGRTPPPPPPPSGPGTFQGKPISGPLNPRPIGKPMILPQIDQSRMDANSMFGNIGKPGPSQARSHLAPMNTASPGSPAPSDPPSPTGAVFGSSPPSPGGLPPLRFSQLSQPNATPSPAHPAFAPHVQVGGGAPPSRPPGPPRLQTNPEAFYQTGPRPAANSHVASGPPSPTGAAAGSPPPSPSTLSSMNSSQLYRPDMTGRASSPDTARVDVSTWQQTAGGSPNYTAPRPPMDPTISNLPSPPSSPTAMFPQAGTGFGLPLTAPPSRPLPPTPGGQEAGFAQGAIGAGNPVPTVPTPPKPMFSQNTPSMYDTYGMGTHKPMNTIPE